MLLFMFISISVLDDLSEQPNEDVHVSEFSCADEEDQVFIASRTRSSTSSFKSQGSFAKRFVLTTVFTTFRIFSSTFVVTTERY